MSKVVWVLGSGFSRSLGGPLMEELFDEHRWVWAKSLVKDLARRRGLAEEPKILEKLERLQNLFAVVRDKNLRAPWRNAEEFLEMWEIATDDRNLSADTVRRQQLFVNIINRCLKNPQRALLLLDLTSGARYDGRARSYLVAMTHEFLHQIKPEGERWAPYIRWARELTENDQIITFNYDLVVERAYDATFKEEIKKTILVAPKELRHGMLHKLHGSVDWIVRGTSSEEWVGTGHDPFEEMLGTSIPAVGIPGPGKASTSSRLFAPQWEAAKTALQEADTIFIIGYSFPQTDNFAKQVLLDAIRANRNEHLVIRLVLGPDRDRTVVRLESMLAWALNRRTPGRPDPRSVAMLKMLNPISGPLSPGQAGIVSQEVVHVPMYAEDFLTVFDRGKM